MLTRVNIISDCQSDVWWCSMGLKACVLYKGCAPPTVTKGRSPRSYSDLMDPSADSDFIQQLVLVASLPKLLWVGLTSYHKVHCISGREEV